MNSSITSFDIEFCNVENNYCTVNFATLKQLKENQTHYIRFVERGEVNRTRISNFGPFCTRAYGWEYDSVQQYQQGKPHCKCTLFYFISVTNLAPFPGGLSSSPLQKHQKNFRKSAVKKIYKIRTYLHRTKQIKCLRKYKTKKTRVM